MNWLWSMSWPMMLAETAAIAVAFVSLSLLAIPCFVEARYHLMMRNPEYRRKREAISRHVADIAEACDQLQAAYKASGQGKPALRLVESRGEELDDFGELASVGVDGPRLCIAP